MVKRVKTPEAPEVVKYYTCCHPYPNNADFEDTTDYITFARWIGIILGSYDSLYAIYYKPKARGKVIFAVDKSYPRPERLLGEHRWSEFLKKTRKNEAQLRSQIFYCTYNTDRNLQKEGWKCIEVQNFFFANFGIDKWFTKVPYPAPHWCQPPFENPTEKHLCRPLPSAQVPQPQPSASAQRPVVGSSVWAQSRDNSNKANGMSRGNARNDVSEQKPAPGAAKRTTAQRANTAPSQSSFPPLSSAPPGKKAQSLSSATNNGSVWGNRPSSVASAEAKSSPLSAPPTSTAHTIWQTKTKSRAGKASPSTSSNAKPASASNLEPGSVAAKGADSTIEKLDRMRATDNKTPAPNSTRAGKSWRSRSSSSSSGHSGGSTTVSAASSAPSSPAPSSSARDQELVDFNATEYDYNDDYDEEVTHEMYHERWETTSTFAPSEPPAPAVRIGSSNAKGKRREHGSHPFIDAIEQEITGPTEKTNVWANLEPIIRSTGIVTAAEAKAKENNELLCPVHRGKCKKGICEAYKEAKKLQRKSQRKQENKVKKEEEKRKKQQEEKRKQEEDKKDDGDTEGEGGKGKYKRDAEHMNDEGNNKSGDKNDGGNMEGEGKGGDKPDNEQAKKDTGQQSSKGEGQAKSRSWAEYTESDDDDDFYDNIPSFSSKPGGKKFYDDDDYYE